jgi:hypothetical protein
VASVSHGETIENATGQAPLTTFESRWLPAEIILFADATTVRSPGSVPILDREEEPAPDVMESLGVDSEQMFRLLGATLMSVGIALGLYALIGSSAAPWRRTRDRVADPRSRLGASFIPSSPPLDSTISGIVERLSREDALSEGHEPGRWEAESDRVTVEYPSGSQPLASHYPPLAARQQVSRDRH